METEYFVLFAGDGEIPHEYVYTETNHKVSEGEPVGIKNKMSGKWVLDLLKGIDILR